MKKMCPYCGRKISVNASSGRFARHTYSDLRTPCQGSGQKAS